MSTTLDSISERILFEDNHLLAIYKLPGELVQGDKTGDTPLLDQVKSFLKEKYNKPGNVYLGCVHRLDRPVGGVVLFTKTSKALSRMNEMIRKREGIEKVYWAIVPSIPNPEEGHLEHYLWKNQNQNKSYVSKADKKGAKKATLHYKTIGKSQNYFLVEIDLHSGRHHQIRVQLSSIGCVIKGDLKYGAPRSNKDGSISLLAKKMTFIHPIKKEKISIEAPIPNDTLWQAFQPA